MSLLADWAIYFSAIFIFVATVCGILFGFCRLSYFAYFYGEAFYVGIFVSVAFFHFLNESFSKDDTNYNSNSLAFSISFLAFLIIEIISRQFSRLLKEQSTIFEVQSPVTPTSQMQTILIPYLENNGHPITFQESIILGSRLFFSSFLIGVAMGITRGIETIIPMTLAISLSKFLEALALATRILGRINKAVFWILTISYSLLTPSSSLLASRYMGNKNSKATAICDAVSAALFLYIAYSHWQRVFFSPYEYSRKELIIMSILFMAGIAAVALAAINWKNC